MIGRNFKVDGQLLQDAVRAYPLQAVHKRVGVKARCTGPN